MIRLTTEQFENLQKLAEIEREKGQNLKGSKLTRFYKNILYNLFKDFASEDTTVKDIEEFIGICDTLAGDLNYDLGQHEHFVYWYCDSDNLKIPFKKLKSTIKGA